MVKVLGDRPATYPPVVINTTKDTVASLGDVLADKEKDLDSRDRGGSKEGSDYSGSGVFGHQDSKATKQNWHHTVDR